MKETTRLLLDKAERAIYAAEVLRDAEEAEFAAGRVYYAMRYTAEALLFERGPVLRKHTAVQAAFGKDSPRPVRWIASSTSGCSTLPTSASKAIYQAQVQVMDEDVETGLARAREFLSAVKRLLEKSDTKAEAQRTSPSDSRPPFPS